MSRTKGTVTVIDTQTNAVVGSIQTGQGQYGIIPIGVDPLADIVLTGNINSTASIIQLP